MTNELQQTKHTPGPWWRDDDGFIAAGSGDTYVTIADPSCTNDIDLDEREANARLIAAAPEILDALDALMKLDSFISLHESFREPWESVMEKTRAAIAKACGKCVELAA